MNIDNLTTGSLGNRLKDIALKFETMQYLISNSISKTCFDLDVEQASLSLSEFRDPNKILHQYLTCVPIEYCVANPLIISKILSNLQNDVNSLPLGFDNKGRVQFLTHVDESVGLIIEIYLDYLC